MNINEDDFIQLDFKMDINLNEMISELISLDPEILKERDLPYLDIIGMSLSENRGLAFIFTKNKKITIDLEDEEEDEEEENEVMSDAMEIE